MGQVGSQQVSEDARTRVFLSYSRKDAGLVGRVADGLMGAGFLADYDQAAHDPGNVSAGISAEDEWWKRLQEMIASADVMVFLVSPDSALSAVCDEEIAYARALGKRIIAVLARNVDFAKAPPRLSALNVRIDFSDGGPGFDAALAGLVSALQMNVGWHRDGRKYFARVQEWDTAGRPKSRLLREGAVEEAERWALARPRNEPEPGELFLAWVAASRAQIKRDAAVRAFWRRVTAVFVLTTLIATVAGAWFVVNGQRNLGRSESLMLARTSEAFARDGDYLRALQLSILASRNSFLAPSTDEAKAAFAAQSSGMTLQASLMSVFGYDHENGEIEGIEGGAVSPDGARMVTWGGHGLWVWDMTAYSLAGRPIELEAGRTFQDVAFSADSQRLLIRDGQEPALLWDAVTAEPIGEPMRHGDEQVISATFSPDGSRVLTTGVDGVVRLWDGKSATPVAELSQGGATFSAKYSADGRLVYTWNDGGVQFWDAGTGQAVDAPFEMPGISGAVVSSDNARLVTWDREGRLLIRDMGTGAVLGPPKVHGGGFNDALIAEQSGVVVTSEGSKVTRLWSLETGEPIGAPIVNDSGYGPPVISDQAGRLLTWTYLNPAQLWDLQTGELVNEEVARAGELEGGVFSPGGETLFTWSGTAGFTREALTGEILEGPFQVEDGLNDAFFSADGRFLLARASDEKAYLWETASGRQVGPALVHVNYTFGPLMLPGDRLVTIHETSADVWSPVQWTATGVPAGAAKSARVPGNEWMSFEQMSPDGAVSLTAPGDGTASLWAMNGGAAIGNNLAAAGPFLGAVFSPDSKRVAVWSEAGTGSLLEVFDTANAEPVGAAAEFPAILTSVAFTGDSARLLVADQVGAVSLVDAGTGQRIGEPAAHTGVSVPVLSDAAGRAAVWTGRSAVLLDTVTGLPAGAPLEHPQAEKGGEFEDEILGAAFSPDGTRLVTWNFAEARVWDAAAGTATGAVVDGLDGIAFAALSPTGAQVAVGMGDFVSVHDAGSGEMLYTFGAPGDFLSDAVYSDDGRLIAAWQEISATVQMYDAGDGLPRGEPVQMYGEQVGIRFSPDGRRMLLWDGGGSYVIADTATGAVLQQMEHDSSYEAPVWLPGGTSMLTLGAFGTARLWDVSWAMRLDAGPEDVAAVCEAKLRGSAAGGEVPVVRLLDEAAIRAAPILRGREGEDVCTPPPAAWWETAAGVVFGWAFR
ncbi:MAG TPA: TIR domain-containing protein [Burkholderiales bacterium]|nr:TIR domain-containing protein [Burkholderiales bacterium]